MRTHKDLDVWKNSIILIKEIYKVTDKFPVSEVYGLSSQLRKASVSIASNIAEGAARHSKKEFIQFLYIASGSLSEVETQLIIAKELDFIDSTIYNGFIDKINETRAQLHGLIKYLEKRA